MLGWNKTDRDQHFGRRYHLDVSSAFVPEQILNLPLKVTQLKERVGE